MDYGGTRADEQEVTIRLDREGQQAHICSTWPAWSRKLERRYGSPKRATEREGKITSAFWVVPLTAIRVGRPRRGRALGVEERQAATARLLKARAARPRTV